MNWRRLSRILLFLPLILVGLGFLGGWLFWHYMARETEAALDLWQQQEASLGRRWTCPDRQLSGFPFEIIVACTKPRFQGEIEGRVVEGNLAGFTASAALQSPNRIFAHLQGPFAAHTRDETFDITLNWDELGLELNGDNGIFDHWRLDARKLDLSGRSSDFGPFAAEVDDIKASLESLRNRSDFAYDFHLNAQGVRLAALDAFFDTTVPADLGADGSLTQLRFVPGGLLLDQIDAWRQAGGSITFTNAWLTKGQVHIGLEGNLALDSQHRPTGRMQARFSGLDDLLRSYGVNPSLVQAGSLLNSLFGGNRGSTKQESDSALRLPMRISEGWLYIGPVRTPLSWPPLY